MILFFVKLTDRIKTLFKKAFKGLNLINNIWFIVFIPITILTIRSQRLIWLFIIPCFLVIWLIINSMDDE